MFWHDVKQYLVRVIFRESTHRYQYYHVQLRARNETNPETLQHPAIDVMKVYQNQVSTYNFHFSLLLSSNAMCMTGINLYDHKY